MNEPKKTNPMMKVLLEWGPLLVFFVSYIWLKDETFLVGGVEYSGFIAVTAIFVPLLALTTFLLYRLTGKISVMQIMTLVLVVVFGGLTIWLNDERFFKMKPTIIYLLFAGILGFGLLRGKSYLQLAIQEVLPMEFEGWIILTRRMMIFFVVLAITNEVIWRALTTDTWVKFKVFGLPIAMFVFFMAQSKMMQKYAIEEDEA